MSKKILLLVLLMVLSLTATSLADYNIFWENFVESPEIKRKHLFELSYIVSKYDDYEEYNDGTDPEWIIKLLDLINDYHHKAKLIITPGNSTEIYGILNYLHDYTNYPVFQTFSLGIKQNIINKEN